MHFSPDARVIGVDESTFWILEKGEDGMSFVKAIVPGLLGNEIR